MKQAGWIHGLGLALGCALCTTACNDASLLGALRSEHLAVGARNRGPLSLRGCANTDCSPSAITPEPTRVESKEVSCSTPINAVLSTWEVRDPRQLIGQCHPEDGCGEGYASFPEIAVAPDQSLWVLTAGEHLEFSPDPDTVLPIATTRFLALLHHSRSGELRETQMVAPDGDFGEPHLVALGDGRLIVASFVEGSERLRGPNSLSEHSWVAVFDADGVQVGERIELDLPERELSGLPLPVVAPAGDHHLAIVQPGGYGSPGFAALLDVERRTLDWVQTRSGLEPAWGAVVADDSGVTLLANQLKDGLRTNVDHLEHYGRDGKLQWSRAIDRGAYGDVALARGADGNLIYTALVFYAKDPSSLSYWEEMRTLEFASDGQYLRGIHTQLPDRGMADAPGNGLALRPSATTVPGGSLAVPIGERAIGQLAADLGLSGSLFYEVDLKREVCRLEAFGTGRLEVLRATEGGDLYFASLDSGYGLLHDATSGSFGSFDNP